LDQLLLKQYPERRINNSDRLKGCEIDIDAIIEMIPRLQEQWELENPQQDNEHERGLKRRREESDVQLYEATNKAKAAEASAKAAEASAKAAEASAKAEEASAKAAEVSVNVERFQLDNELYRIKLQMLKEGKITLQDMKIEV
jgi:membrane protein involved in colicin uptake